jgi:type IVB pilus formation R64 PilN family outer membrane protein
MIVPRVLFLLAMLAAPLVSACAPNTVSHAEHAVDDQTHDATHYLDMARQPLPAANTSSVRIVDGIFGSAVAHRSDHGLPLPRKFEVLGISIVNADPLPVFEIGSKITEATGIPVSFAPDVASTGTGSHAGAAAAPAESSKSATPTSGSNGAKTATSQPPAAGAAASPPSPGTITSMLNSLSMVGGNSTNSDDDSIRAVVGSQDAMVVNYQGRLSSFLNQVGAHFGINWAYSGGEIRMFRNMTRTFTVHALPVNSLATTATLSATAPSTSGGSTQLPSASGGSTQTATADVTFKIWDELTQAVTSIVAGSGHVATLVSTGSISVTAPVETINRVQAFIDGQNARLSKQVTVNVQVLSIALTDADNYNLDIQGLFVEGYKYGLTLGNTAGQSALTILQSSGSTNPAIGGIIGSGNGPFGGSNAVLQALSTRGRVSVVTTTSVTTINNIPAPFQVTNTRGYLASVQTTSTGALGAGGVAAIQTTLTPGSVTTGFNMSVLPRVADDAHTLLLQVGLNISTLAGPSDGFYVLSSGGQEIQLPDVNQQNFVQSANIPDGATLAIAGYEQLQDNATRSGIGTPEFFLLGGGAVGNHGRNVIVILITPTILNVPLISSS